MQFYRNWCIFKLEFGVLRATVLFLLKAGQEYSLVTSWYEYGPPQTAFAYVTEGTTA